MYGSGYTASVGEEEKCVGAICNVCMRVCRLNGCVAFGLATAAAFHTCTLHTLTHVGSNANLKCIRRTVHTFNPNTEREHYYLYVVVVVC